MSKLEGTNLRVVLYEGPGAAALDPMLRFEVLSALLDHGYEVTVPVSGGRVSPQDTAPLVVLGLFDHGTLPQSQDGNGRGAVVFCSISNLDPPDVVDRVHGLREELGARTPGAWKPWFPVIDYDRCTNCMQCLSFCLFDVYGVNDNQQIRVQNQDNCKTDCPACSRVCPEVAILFPKYKSGPINGDVVREEDIQREAMKVNVSDLLGGDIYASLRKRSADARERFSTERDESRALLERKRCLKKLKKDLDIPDEVLMSLPSAGDIEERAKRARAKAEARRARSLTVKDQHRAVSEKEWGI